MTAGTQSPLALVLETLDTPLGGFTVVTDRQGWLRAAEFADRRHRLDRSLGLRFAREGFELKEGTTPANISSALRNYFDGDAGAIDRIPVVLDGTDFQNKVWNALRLVEAGRPISYSTLAARIGKPEAVRAVGAANGANPFSVVIPCHRLVGANGALTGYGGGIERKRWLIDHEASSPRLR
ncbi:methylated-DNA--[protein]-cysteine S-methyltransferase [Pseudaminobacter soli (ex Li et al. 2025)]|uniref:methylated-DNA--[protein]-cysteine S-methyltransferase n=1 Tax=Pseudaminobacter soli (ex Li et al. 2025) TaxID=1295366 RepID=A0A2P7RXJ2_9HYPH|nr:methylated-DNA--[protein]-cysteine S-methyltransferase [Mesorhizobium soli]PSJ54938.1 methylated-DNA--protein-cysteine methyltransferase [Mesorhizobium soli]